MQRSCQEVSYRDVEDDEVEGDDVDDDDVEGQEEDDVENEDVEEEEDDDTVTDADVEEGGRSIDRAARFARACAIHMHFSISQEPGNLRENCWGPEAGHRLCARVHN